MAHVTRYAQVTRRSPTRDGIKLFFFFLFSYSAKNYDQACKRHKTSAFHISIVHNFALVRNRCFRYVIYYYTIFLAGFPLLMIFFTHTTEFVKKTH